MFTSKGDKCSLKLTSRISSTAYFYLNKHIKHFFVCGNSVSRRNASLEYE